MTRALVEAINANDRAAFFGLLAPDATMSDDGSDRDLESWVFLGQQELLRAEQGVRGEEERRSGGDGSPTPA